MPPFLQEKDEAGDKGLQTDFTEELQFYVARGVEAYRDDIIALARTAANTNLYAQFAQDLKNLPGLDWGLYLEEYPDVAKTGLDPWLHYVKYGLWERRILPAVKRQRASANSKDEPARAPLLSVIIPNYNNRHFLDKSIGSLRGQTYSNIEIIVVDDASDDGSMEVLQRLARDDSRMRVIPHAQNRGTHAARSTGVEAATGDYIMFLDPDDYYVPKACETALRAMQGGVDIGHFNGIIQNFGVSREAEERIKSVINGLPMGDYTREQILHRQLVEREMMHNVCNKIFRAPLIKAAFSNMEDSYFCAGEDMYEFLFILADSKRLRKIDDPLYVYNYGVGISSSVSRHGSFDNISLHSGLFPSLARYYSQMGLAYYIDYIKDILFTWSMGAWAHIETKFQRYFLQKMKEHYGREFVFDSVIRKFWKNPQELSQKLSSLPMPYSGKIPSSLALLLTGDLTMGGLDYLANLGTALKKRGVSLHLFFEPEPPLRNQSKETSRGMPIIPAKDNPEKMVLRIRQLWHDWDQYEIDMVIQIGNAGHEAIWDVLAAQVYGIPRILALPPLCTLLEMSGKNLRSFINALGIESKIICSSPEDEMLLRICGADAECGLDLHERLYRDSTHTDAQEILEKDVESLYNIMFLYHERICTLKDYGQIIYKDMIHSLVTSD